MADGLRPYHFIIVRTQFTDEREISCWEKKGSDEIYEIVLGDKVIWNNHKPGDNILFINRMKKALAEVFYRPCYIMSTNYEENIPTIISHIQQCDKTVSNYEGYFIKRYTMDGARILFIDVESDVDWT